MPLMQSPPGAYTVIDGRRYLYFVGTGYLGLQGHPEVIRAACEATEKFGIGTATSRTGFGDCPPTLEVERRAAQLFGMEEAFYFSSGYVGNHILALAIDDTFDAVFVDEWSHYCVFEAARLAGRPVFPFRHCSADDLRVSLKTNLPCRGRPLVLTDGVFAARGEIAPVADFADVLREFPGSILSIDDAHGLATLGTNGRGTYEHARLYGRGVNESVGVSDASGKSPPCPALLCCGTLSKAVGGFGGIIPGSQEFIQRLKDTSPYYRGASAPPVPVAAATARALQLIAAEPQIRTRLWQNVAMLKTGLRAMGLDTDDTPVPICCLSVGDAANMRRIQQTLMEQGIAIAYMAAYSGLGPEGALRVAVFASHTEEMIRQLLDALRGTI